MSSIGMADVSCAALMIAGPDNPYLQHGVSLFLLALTVGSALDKYAAKLPMWHWLPTLSVGSLLLVRILTRPRLRCRQTKLKEL